MSNVYLNPLYSHKMRTSFYAFFSYIAINLLELLYKGHALYSK